MIKGNRSSVPLESFFNEYKNHDIIDICIEIQSNL